MSCIEFTVNGKKCTVTSSTPRDTSLNAYLRYALALPGTKAMCREGGCGACVVTVRARRQPSSHIETFSVNSCLVLVFSCHGWEITTIEGLGNRHIGYNEIQKRVVAFNATQCGYCTPGWVMHLNRLSHITYNCSLGIRLNLNPYPANQGLALVQQIKLPTLLPVLLNIYFVFISDVGLTPNGLRDKNLTMKELERAMGSNTCRCTGFRPILDTFKSFAVDADPQLCQRVRDMEDLEICSKTKTVCQRKCSTRSEEGDWAIINDITATKDGQSIYLDFGKKKFFKVFNEDAIFEVLANYGVDSYMLVDGDTAKGLVETFEYPRILIDISDVKSLKKYYLDQNLVLGANISLEDCITIFKELAKSRNDEFAYLEEFAKHFDLIAHIPVRQIGSLAGNLVAKNLMPSYQSDVFLLLASVGAMITIRSSNSAAKSLSMTGFLEYDLQGSLIVNILLPPLSRSHIFRSYKIMPRNQNALAIVNAAFNLKMDKRNEVIEEANIVYGNISAYFVHATQTEAYLRGKKIFMNSTLQAAINILSQEINPEDKPPEPSPECRKKLAIGLFYKFILNICEISIPAPFYRSGGSLIKRPVSRGTQDYQTHKALYPLNQPVHKYEAFIQSSGEAQYANDIPPLPREVFAAFVLSTIHVGEVDKIYAMEALDIEGVLAVYTAEDVPGKNSFIRPGYQLLTEDEEILVSKNILYYGQPVAIVVAEREELAALVAKQIKVTYKNVSSAAPVLTIDQAKRDSKRYLASDQKMEPKGKGDNVTKVINGVYDIPAQYHYYLEPITCVVVPVDRGLDVYDSSQWMDLTQTAIAQSLGIKESEVFVYVRRVGGGFGGKLSRNAQAATACAIVAKKMDRPCRFITPMQTNLTMSGRRLPCQCEYEVGVDDVGKIQYLNANIVEDDGCSRNENVLEYTVGGFQNCYNTDYFNVRTGSVLTDLPSNTFMRAPGTSEGMACIEHIMEHISYAVNKDATEVRLANMRTTDNEIPGLIKELKKDADYYKRAKEIEQFNQVNRWKKKAIKISVMRFPIIYLGNYSAMVSIYRGDGTVTVTTGGIEMGQGANTKAAQVCAYELGIPLKYVSIIPHFSFVAANNVFSGSSIVSESVCYSIIKACDILKKRLEPVKQKLTNPTWKELIFQAGQDLVDLTATHMMTDRDLENYYSYAVAILEVELDVLTGRYEILRSDILEDVGLSTNPQIDVGQVEGAYVQGLGYYTTEKLVFNKNTGRLLTNRSLNYHVPLALDIPADFRIRLRYNSINTKGVLGSKTVGEMGICTAHGISHALRQCIMESRKDSGHDWTNFIYIDVPYDTESILKALDVKYEEMILTQ